MGRCILGQDGSDLVWKWFHLLLLEALEKMRPHLRLLKENVLRIIPNGQMKRERYRKQPTVTASKLLLDSGDIDIPALDHRLRGFVKICKCEQAGESVKGGVCHCICYRKQ